MHSVQPHELYDSILQGLAREVPRDHVERQAHILGPGSAAAQALHNAALYEGETRFWLLMVEQSLVVERVPHPVLFLDIDGVLVTGQTAKVIGFRKFDPTRVARLQKVVEQVPHLRVILHAAMNAHGPEALEKKLREAGWTLDSVTLTTDMNYKGGLDDWCQENLTIGTRAVRLQDDLEEYTFGPWVKTTWNDGLTQEKADQLLLELTRR